MVVSHDPLGFDVVVGGRSIDDDGRRVGRSSTPKNFVRKGFRDRSDIIVVEEGVGCVEDVVEVVDEVEDEDEKGEDDEEDPVDDPPKKPEIREVNY